MNTLRRPGRFAAVTAAVLVLSATAACSSDPILPKPFDHPVRVGFKTTAPGMSALDAGAGVQGFEPRLVQGVLGDAHVQYTAVTIAASNWQDALLDGNTNHNGIDVAFADISATDERQKQFDMAGPYLQTQLGALSWGTRAVPVNRQEDLKHLRVCTVAQTTARALVDNEVKPEVSVDGATSLACLDDLRNNTADVFVSDYLVLRGIAVNTKENGSPVYAVAKGKFGKMQSLVAVLPKGHTAACEWLRGKIDTYMKSQAWVDELRSNFAFPLSEATDDNLRSDFQPTTSSAGKLCAA